MYVLHDVVWYCFENRLFGSVIKYIAAEIDEALFRFMRHIKGRVSDLGIKCGFLY